MPFNFYKTELADVILIEPKIFKDGRGSFIESYKYSEFKKAGIEVSFFQDNISKSTRGVLRGLHYQKEPMAQGKLVRVLKGEVFDVAVDIRIGSPDYGKWVGYNLSDQNMKMLYIPAGFAHGFLVLKDETEVFYKVTSEYSPENERGIIWNDPDINIKWPIKDPVLSDKDTTFPCLKNAEDNFKFK